MQKEKSPEGQICSKKTAEKELIRGISFFRSRKNNKEGGMREG